MKKNIIRIATWNTRSWNSKAQRNLIELTHKNIDICAISETKKKVKKSFPTKTISCYLAVSHSKPVQGKVWGWFYTRNTKNLLMNFSSSPKES